MTRSNRSLALCALSALGAAIGLCPTLQAQVVQQYQYQPDQVYPIRTALGITTQIELSPDEQVLDYSTGLSSGWDLRRRDNVFYLRPRNVEVDTNMSIRTATHAYLFELQVVATDWKTLAEARRNGVEYKVTFRYPAGSRFGKANTSDAQPTGLSTTLLPTRQYNFDYDYATRKKAAPWLLPVHVYDDGRFTYIELGNLQKFPSGDFPAVFMRETEGGEDSLVNTTVEGNTIVVHGTYPYLVMRHGEDVVGLRRNIP